MATSGTYSLTITGGNIVTDILYELGVLAHGSSASGDTAEFIRRKINFWLLEQNGQKSRFRPGNMMWTRESATLTLNTTDTEYDLKPSGGDLNIQIPYEIIFAYYRDSDGNDTPLEWMDEDELLSIADKDSTGTPRKYHYEKKLSTGKFYIDCVPDEANSVIIKYKQPLELITSSSVEFDIDPSWYRAIVKNIAKDAAPAFGMGMDDPRYQAIATDAAESLAIVNSFFPNDKIIQMRPK